MNEDQNQVPQAPVAPAPVMPPKKQGMLPALVVILLIAILPAVGWFAWDQGFFSAVSEEERDAAVMESTATTEERLNTLSADSTSTAEADIESDLNEADLESFDADMAELARELGY